MISSKGLGLVAGGAAVGAAGTYGLMPKETATHQPRVQRRSERLSNTKPSMECWSQPLKMRNQSSGVAALWALVSNSMPTRVEVKNGKIVRIRPVRYADEGYDKDYQKPWKIEVRGEVLEPSYKKVLVTPLG